MLWRTLKRTTELFNHRFFLNRPTYAEYYHKTQHSSSSFLVMTLLKLEWSLSNVCIPKKRLFNLLVLWEKFSMVDEVTSLRKFDVLMYLFCFLILPNWSLHSYLNLFKLISLHGTPISKKQRGSGSSFHL